MPSDATVIHRDEPATPSRDRVSPAAVPRDASSLGPRAIVLIHAALLIVTVVVFGTVLLGLLLIPGARAAFVPVMAAALLVHPASMLLTLHVGLRRAGSGWRAIGLRRPTVRMLHLLWQVPTILVLLLLVQGLALLLTGDPTTEGRAVDTLVGDTAPVVVVVVLIGVVLLAPLWEEVVFRGLVHGGLRRRLGPVMASLLGAAIFAACHGVPVLLPYMLMLGLSLAYLREFHRTLWAPLCMHVVVNGLATGVALAAVQA
ncbi:MULTISPECIES: CPBP family intramembrane glutamic endopeptidase [Clavibacter]|uniref:CPBP family intramembrane metalloprotease n=2 Tax=Clavibacter TaxID=1573 RepID=A0A399NV19_9MICO|nr:MULTISPECIES: type II CAAX endopeptidase family protein [Clavibacter]KDP91076.1 abortive infection protein [Clavibacter cf. michiganensis LMG 26808]RII97844.1 CPBP family intramembrane metalloprotease [Clavibacter michiganensis]UKF25725.1 CPBP family intramembrane metalloprotease [Clavibacter sp. A6099]